MTQRIPQNPSRRHHYIPRFYLKRWTVDGQVVVYSRGRFGRVAADSRSTKSTGFEVDLYTVPGLPPEQAQEVERQFMAGVDEGAEEIIRRLLAGDLGKLSPVDRTHMARFIVSMILRTPEEVAKLKSGMRDYFSSPFPELEKRYQAQRQPGDPASLADFEREHMPDFAAQMPFDILQTLINHRSVVPTIANLRWEVIDTSSAPIGLLTSDRPVVMSNGLQRPDGHFAIPLDPSKLLLAGVHERFMTDVRRMPARQIVARVNHVVAGQAVRFVYGVDRSRRAWVDKRLNTLDRASWVGVLKDEARGRGLPLRLH